MAFVKNADAEAALMKSATAAGRRYWREYNKAFREGLKDPAKRREVAEAKVRFMTLCEAIAEVRMEHACRGNDDLHPMVYESDVRMEIESGINKAEVG